MARTILVMALAVAICQAAVQPMSQDTLRDYLVNGAPFDFVLIDLRSSGEIMELIGNKDCQPYNLEWPAQFKEESAKIPKDCAIIVYCHSGGRATGAANYLNTNGYTKVFNAGGMLTWKGPTVPPSKIKPATLLPEPSMRAKTGAGQFSIPEIPEGLWMSSLHPGFGGRIMPANLTQN